MKNPTQDQFLREHLLEELSYAEIQKRYSLDNSFRKQMSSWYAEGGELLVYMRRANQVFTSKRLICTKRYNDGKTKANEFQFFLDLGRVGFFDWYNALERNCAYCGIEEEKLAKIFGPGPNQISTKRNRGPKLELERRDAKSNLYNPENCVLACYLCNNHKSDLINEKDHRKHFAGPIKTYLEAKYKKVIKSA